MGQRIEKTSSGRWWKIETRRNRFRPAFDHSGERKIRCLFKQIQYGTGCAVVVLNEQCLWPDDIFANRPRVFARGSRQCGIKKSPGPAFFIARFPNLVALQELNRFDSGFTSFA